MSGFGFKSLKRSCPICDGARRDCRENLNTGLIHCRDANANPGGQWRYIKDDAHGFGMWVWDDGSNGTDNRDNRPSYAPKEPSAPAVASWPVEQRDKGYRPMAGALALTHRIDIRKRPQVTDQEIDALVSAGVLFTWPGGQTVAGAGVGLPGVKGDGRLMASNTWAIGIPNEDGQIAGVQLRNPKGGYFWASTPNGGATPHVDGELPLALYGVPQGGVLEVAEGYLKPALAQARYGGGWLGMAGGQWANVPKQLRAALDANSITQAILNADGGAIHNPNVMRDYRALANLLQDWGYSLKVRWWGQTEKSHGDVDEIAPEAYHGAKLLTWAEFEGMAPEAVQDRLGKQNPVPTTEPTDAQRVAEALGLGMVSDAMAQQLIQEFYAPGQVEHDLTIINGPDGISPADQAKLLNAGRPVLADGRTGCGKTEMVARIRPRIEGKKLGTADTITLAGGMAKRFGAIPVSSQHEPATKNTWKDAVTPAESIYRSMGHDYALWAVDEVDKIFPRWLMGNLGSTGQTRNQKQARWLGRTVPHQFCLQAQPSPITLDAIEHFTGKRPLVVNLVREPQLESNVTVHILEDSTDRATGATLSGIKTAVDMAINLTKAGGRSAFFGGSKDVLKALQREFRKKGIQATLRDGTYTLAPVAVGFGENPTKHCNLALITLISLNADTGVDLQNDFDAVFALPSVQQSASEAWQHISRARSLFDGRTKDLYIHFPQDPTRFMAWEHLTPQYHLEKIKARNAYYLSLIAQGTPELREEIADLEAGFTLAARYMAEHCAGRWFQREYLLGQFEARGWPVDTIAPAPSALGFLDTLARHRDKAIDAEAFAIAKGKRHLLEYSEKRATEIEDSNQSGFVLGCYRTKLALASHFPSSPLEDPKWIRANILDKPAKKAQTRLLGLFTLDNAQAAVDDHTRFLQREAIKHGDDHGALSMLRKLESSDTLPILRLYQALSPHRGIIQAALANMATLSASHPDALALADVLRQNADTLNQFAAKCLDDSNGFDWTEAEPMALVSKFINKYIGIPFGRAGQRRTAVGTENQYQVGYCPEAIYRKANNAKGKLETWQARLDAQQALLAKRQTSKRVKPETITKIQNRIADLTATVATRMAEYQEELSQANAQRDEVAASVRPHLEMAISAAQGWMERLNFAPITKTSPVTLNAGYQSLVRGFSVTPPGNAQADPPPEPQPPETVDRATWRELREWFATAVMDGVAAIEALRDTVLSAFGPTVWQALEAIA